jgi:hypothetical protein
VDDSKLYPSLLGLNLAFDNHNIIDLKNRKMIFEVGDLRFNAPLEPIEGRQYLELARGGFNTK